MIHRLCTLTFVFVVCLAIVSSCPILEVPHSHSHHTFVPSHSSQTHSLYHDNQFSVFFRSSLTFCVGGGDEKEDERARSFRVGLAYLIVSCFPLPLPLCDCGCAFVFVYCACIGVLVSLR